MTRENRLSAFMESIASEDMIWGVNDCTQVARRWVEAETGRQIDGINYQSRLEAYKHIKERGGLDTIWREQLSVAGFYQTQYPEYGDIGICDTGRSDIGMIGVIVLHGGAVAWRSINGWRMFSPRGMTTYWTVPKS